MSEALQPTFIAAETGSNYPPTTGSYLELQANFADSMHGFSLIGEHQLDELTGLGSRELFWQDLNRLVDQADNAVTPGEQPDVLVVVFDLNGLKETNDTWGHAVGDQMLQAAAHGMKTGIGQLQEQHAIGQGGEAFEDTEIARAYHFSGDEFGVIMRLPGRSDAALATTASTSGRQIDDRRASLVQTLVDGIESQSITLPTGEALPVSTAVGCTTYEPTQTSKTLFEGADTAMLEHKAKSKLEKLARQAAEDRAAYRLVKILCLLLGVSAREFASAVDAMTEDPLDQQTTTAEDREAAAILLDGLKVLMVPRQMRRRLVPADTVPRTVPASRHDTLVTARS